MTPRDRERFPAVQAVLADGIRTLIRTLRTGDVRILGDFYLSVPAQDCRFYRNRPLTREQAATTAHGLWAASLIRYNLLQCCAY